MSKRKHATPTDRESQAPLDERDQSAQEADPRTDQEAPLTGTQESDRAVSLESRLQDLQSQRDELEARLTRSFADYQNFARRSQQNVVEAKEQQLLELAKALVTVLDHFDKALEVDPDATSTTTTTTIKGVIEGVQIVRDELVRTLERFGIQRLDVEPGEEFNPRQHEALMRQAVEGMEPNHVAAQFQPGYVLGEKTVRPAKVSVTE